GSEDLRPADVEYLIAQHLLRCPHDRLQLTHHYATGVFPAFIGGESTTQDGGELPATLRRPTFASYYKSVTQALASIIKEAQLGDMSGKELLQFAAMVVNCWYVLSRITQQLDQSMQRSVLTLALRGGYSLVDQFTRTILPRLDSIFLMHRDEAIVVLGRMQKCTRILQNICNHSKASKDTRLQSAVPQTKRKLEQLIFQVYALMDNNDCIGAINMANLKHRDIHGDVVSSQIAPELSMSASESDDALAADDDDNDDADADAGLGDIVVEYAPSDDGEDSGEPSPRPRNLATRGRGGGRRAASPGPRAATSKAKRSDLVQRRRMLAQRRQSATARGRPDDDG
ncbi:hypothetical protein LPJ61_004543, partial [Coemansia biformis]